MSNFTLFTGLVAAVSISGCLARDARAPGANVNLNASAEFEFVKDVSGRACTTRFLNIPFQAQYSVAGVQVVENQGLLLDSLVDESVAAAAYEAFMRSGPADAIIITMARTNGHGIPLFFSHYCSDVAGRTIRLRPAGTPATPPESNRAGNRR